MPIFSKAGLDKLYTGLIGFNAKKDHFSLYLSCHKEYEVCSLQSIGFAFCFSRFCGAHFLPGSQSQAQNKIIIASQA